MLFSSRLFSVLVVLLISSTHVVAVETLKLATTTSVDETGLLEAVVTPFESMHACSVQVIAVGSGKAIKLAKNGDVDIILVHAPRAEASFVAEGLGVNRRLVMFNEFVIAGPQHDPAGIATADDALTALEQIAAQASVFISRGDNSGTHMREAALWKETGLKHEGAWYLESGQGMSATLRMAEEKQGYVLVDRATYFANADKQQLHMLFTGDTRLYNPYSIIAVSPYRHDHVSYDLAMQLIGWLTSPACQKIISEFRFEDSALFFPVTDLPEDSLAKQSTPNGVGLPLGDLYEIVVTSLLVCLSSTVLATVIGCTLGIIVALKAFRGREGVVTILNTMMSMPTVVIGLLIYSALSHQGPWGRTGLLYTRTAIVIGQFILALPIVAALTISAVRSLDSRVGPTVDSLGANSIQGFFLFVREARYGLMAAVVAGFSRIFSEIGVSMMLGGNIRGYTRTITTAIALETSKGEFVLGLMLGAILLVIAFLVGLVFVYFQRRAK